MTNTTLVDVSAQIRSSSDCMCSRVISSRAPNGSSISSSAGWAARARAMATRCCIPPDSCHGRCSAKSPSLTSCSISIARCRRLDLSQPFSSSGSSTFLTTLRQSNSPACWKAMPYSWSSRARSADFPLTVIAPVLGSMRLAIRRSNVDLPQPDGPIRLTNSPAATVRSTSTIASTWRVVPGLKTFDAVSTTTAGSLIKPPLPGAVGCASAHDRRWRRRLPSPVRRSPRRRSPGRPWPGPPSTGGSTRG